MEGPAGMEAYIAKLEGGVVFGEFFERLFESDFAFVADLQVASMLKA